MCSCSNLPVCVSCYSYNLFLSALVQTAAGQEWRLTAWHKAGQKLAQCFSDRTHPQLLLMETQEWQTGCSRTSQDSSRPFHNSILQREWSMKKQVLVDICLVYMKHWTSEYKRSLIIIIHQLHTDIHHIQHDRDLYLMWFTFLNNCLFNVVLWKEKGRGNQIILSTDHREDQTLSSGKLWRKNCSSSAPPQPHWHPQ